MGYSPWGCKESEATESSMHARIKEIWYKCHSPRPAYTLWGVHCALPVHNHGTCSYCFYPIWKSCLFPSKRESKKAPPPAAPGTERWAGDRPTLQLTLFFSLMIRNVDKTGLNHLLLSLCGLNSCPIQQLLISFNVRLPSAGPCGRHQGSIQQRIWHMECLWSWHLPEDRIK